ncbi:hypothetical protein [Streptomyces sp. NPDC047990]|uniref:hypothetical protein n=1 Tax=Streptomyces sp. NPDC047990 TaxID=3365496 RepID=UPI0037220658
MCASDWTADDIGWGLLLHRGEVSQSYLWRSGQVRDYSAAGLINYGTEWRRWSAGDRYWALQTRQPAALYGPVELP